MSRVCDLNACANASGKGRSDMTVNVLEAAADIFLQKDTGVGVKWLCLHLGVCVIILDWAFTPNWVANYCDWVTKIGMSGQMKLNLLTYGHYQWTKLYENVQ